MFSLTNFVLLLCLPAPLWTDTLWATPSFPSACSRVWSPWNTPSPSTTWAASSPTTLWAKSPVDSGSTNSRWTKTVRVCRHWDPHHGTRRSLYINTAVDHFIASPLLRRLAPSRATQDYVARYFLMPSELPSRKYSVYLFNSSLLLRWSGAASDNMPLFLVQISHTTQWWMLGLLSSVR